MATLTREEISDRALEALGVKAAGQASSAEDANRAREAFDGVYAQLRKRELAPFSTSAVPDWAWSPMVHVVAESLIPTFGVTGDRAQTIPALARDGRAELAAQVSAKIHNMPVRFRNF